MSTILSTLASTYAATNPPQLAFYALDAEELSDISEKYEVTQVPFLALQRNGQVVETVMGTDAAKVRNAVEKHAGRPLAADGTKASLPPAQQVTRAPAQPISEVSNGAVPEVAAKETTKEELNTRLSELVKAAPVMLFMKGTPSAPQCGFSRQTVGILREHGVKYGFFNILADDDVRQGLKEFSDWPTFPQVYVGGELVGGLDIVSHEELNCSLEAVANTLPQLKEEFENDPEFLKEYSVRKSEAQAA